MKQPRYLWACLIGILLLSGIAAASTLGSTGTARLLLVSRSSGSAGAAIGAARAGVLSADGRYATFSADGGNFVRDLRTARTRRINVGGVAAFVSGARLLAYAGESHLFILSLLTGARTRVSGPDSTLRGRPSISADGRYVAFDGVSSQIYLSDQKTGKMRLVSRASGSDGAIGDLESTEPVLSADGRYVAFTSDAGNLLPGAPRHEQKVYVRDLRTERVRLVSAWKSRPGPHRTYASRPSISANGRFVVFQLVRFGGPASVVVRDLRTGATVNASLLTKTPLELGSGSPVISANGRFLAFRAHNRKSERDELYLVDLRARRTRFVHQLGTDEGGPLSISASGRYLLFDTYVGIAHGDEYSPTSAAGRVYRYANPFMGQPAG